MKEGANGRKEGKERGSTVDGPAKPDAQLYSQVQLFKGFLMTKILPCSLGYLGTQKAL